MIKKYPKDKKKKRNKVLFTYLHLQKHQSSISMQIFNICTQLYMKIEG